MFSEDLAAAESIFFLAGLVWLVIVVWFLFSVAGSLRRIAEAQEAMLIESQIEDELEEG